MLTIGRLMVTVTFLVSGVAMGVPAGAHDAPMYELTVTIVSRAMLSDTSSIKHATKAECEAVGKQMTQTNSQKYGFNIRIEYRCDLVSK